MVRKNRGWLWRSQTYAPAIIALAISAVAATGLASLTKESFAGGGGSRSGITEECNEKKCEVRMLSRTFTPDTLKIRPGATVVWINADKGLHTVTSLDVMDGKAPLFDSDIASPISGGAQWDRTFAADSPGVYRYACAYHPSMTGEVVVTGETIEDIPRLAVMVLAGAGVFGLVAAIYHKKR